MCQYLIQGNCLLLGPVKLRYCQKIDPCTFLRRYVRVFEFERISGKTALSVHNFVMFEIEFNSESFGMTITLLLGLNRLHNSQNFDLCTFSK